MTEGRHKLRFREALVSVEVALSTMLLLAGGLLLFSFMRVLAVDKGVDVSHVITQDIALVNAKYTAEGRNLFLRESLRRLSEIPGVRYAGLTSQLPLRGSAWTDALRDGAIPLSEEKAVGLVQIRFVSAQFLPAMGVRLRQGRLFEEADMTRDVVIISERSAQALWPGENPIGRKVWGSGVRSMPMEVIGTVAEVRTGMETEPPLTMYLPFLQWTLAGTSFAVRTDADPREVMQAMRGVLRSMDSELPLGPTQTMEQIVDSSLAVRRFETWLAGSFAIAALLLAALGVFGVISFTVAKRTPELGVRIALGARPAQLRAMVLRQGMSPVVIGLLAGLAGFVPLRNLIASQLFGVTPQDPAAIAAVILLLLIVAAAACWVPARRAARIDPLQALRCD